MFSITPDPHYHIADVLVDDVSVGAVSSYQFQNVTASHALSAVFAPDTYSVTPSSGAHGSISPGTAQSVTYGDDKTFTITPDTGYAVNAVKVDGVSVGAVTSYTFTGVSSPHTISASFSVAQLSVTPSAGSGGSITPGMAQVVSYGGDSPTFTITPQPDYHIADVLVDDVSVGAVSTYKFTGVTAGHTISASFALNPVRRFEQTDPWIGYRGNWTTLTRNFHSGGSYTFADRPGGKAVIRFRGTAIDYITNKDTVYGIAKVTLDGGTPTFVDLFNPIRNIAQSRVWSATGTRGRRARADHRVDGHEERRVRWLLRGPGRTGRHRRPPVGVLRRHAFGRSPRKRLAWYEPTGPLRRREPGVHDHARRALPRRRRARRRSLGRRGGSYQFQNVDRPAHHLGVVRDRHVERQRLGGRAWLRLAEGDNAVDYGADKTFTITPDTGYHIADVLVDGVSVGAVSSATRPSPTSPVRPHHRRRSRSTAMASRPARATTAASAPSTVQSVVQATRARCSRSRPTRTTTSPTCWSTAVSVGRGRLATTFQQRDRRAHHHGDASRSTRQRSPPRRARMARSRRAGDVAVDYGADKTFTITPDAQLPRRRRAGRRRLGRRGRPLHVPERHRPTHTIAARFAIDTFERHTPRRAGMAPISPTGDNGVDYGADKTFTITPDAHYHVADVLVDGVSVGRGRLATRSRTSPADAHRSRRSFAIDTSNVTASAGAAWLRLARSGDNAVDYGADKTFTITPDAHYHVADVLVDDVSVGAVSALPAFRTSPVRTPSRRRSRSTRRTSTPRRAGMAPSRRRATTPSTTVRTRRSRSRPTPATTSPTCSSTVSRSGP